MLVVQEMLNEAEAEAARAEREISACEEELFEDDKLGQMSAKERAELENEVCTYITGLVLPYFHIYCAVDFFAFGYCNLLFVNNTFREYLNEGAGA